MCFCILGLSQTFLCFEVKKVFYRHLAAIETSPQILFGLQTFPEKLLDLLLFVLLHTVWGMLLTEITIVRDGHLNSKLKGNSEDEFLNLIYAQNYVNKLVKRDVWDDVYHQPCSTACFTSLQVVCVVTSSGFYVASFKWLQVFTFQIWITLDEKRPPCFLTSNKVIFVVFRSHGCAHPG